MGSIACGDSAAHDAGPQGPDANVDAGVLIAAPSAAAMPAMPCASGWREVTGDVAYCAPFAGARDACTGFTMQVPSRTACEPIGVCAPAVAPPGSTRVWHVAIGGTGDGSEASPFGRIGDALAAASGGDAILVGPGTYSELLQVRRGVAIVGSCAAETIVETAVASDRDPVVDVTVSGATISNLTIRGPRVGVWIRPGVEATLSRVALLDLAEASFVVQGSVRLEDSLVAMNTRGRNGRFNAGFDVAARATATIVRSEIRDHADVEVVHEGTVTIEDSTIAQSSGGTGYGVVAISGGQGTVRRTAFEGLAEFGARATDPESTLAIEDSSFAGVTGNSILADTGGAITVTRTSVDCARSTGVAQREASLEATDVVVYSTAAGEGGDGVFLSRGEATLRRVLVHGATRGGISLLDSTVTLEDVSVAGTRGGPPDGDAVAMLSNGSALTATRVEIDTADIFGLLVVGGSLRVTDLEIANVTSSTLDPHGGALWVSNGATATIERANLHDNTGLGAGAAVTGTTLMLVDATIARTRHAFCLDETCASRYGGLGLGVYDGAEITADRFSLEDNELVGAQVATGADLDPQVPGSLDLSNGSIARNTIGVNVQVDGYDFDRLTRNVAFVENGRNIDAAVLPVPTPPPIEF